MRENRELRISEFVSECRRLASNLREMFADMKEADSTEFHEDTEFPVIFKLRDLVDVEELGGTMRLGAWDCDLEEGSLAQKIYGRRADNFRTTSPSL